MALHTVCAFTQRTFTSPVRPVLSARPGINSNSPALAQFRSQAPRAAMKRALDGTGKINDTVRSCAEALANIEHCVRKLPELATSGDSDVLVTTACRDHGELAPDWPTRFEDSCGITWPTVEHYYWAHKFRADAALPGERCGQGVRAHIRGRSWAEHVLAIGTNPELAPLWREEWERERAETMRTALRAAFSQNAVCRAALLATGRRKLVFEDLRQLDEYQFWAGRPHSRYGALLEEVRAELDELPVHFFMPDGPNGELSTHYPAALLAGGKEWPTVEHYFQAHKFAEGAHQEELRARPTALQAHLLGRERRAGQQLRADWDQVRTSVMLDALRYRCLASQQCRDALIATAERRLVYDEPRDAFWGCGEGGGGLNRLGSLLEIVRAEFVTYGSIAPALKARSFTQSALAYMSVPGIAAHSEGQVALSEFNYLRADFEENAEVRAGDIAPLWEATYKHRLEKRMLVVLDARSADSDGAGEARHRLFSNGFEYLHLGRLGGEAGARAMEALRALQQVTLGAADGEVLPQTNGPTERRAAVSALHDALRCVIPAWWAESGDPGRPAATHFLPVDGIVRSTEAGARFGPVGLVHMDFPSLDVRRGRVSQAGRNHPRASTSWIWSTCGYLSTRCAGATPSPPSTRARSIPPCAVRTRPRERRGRSSARWACSGSRSTGGTPSKHGGLAPPSSSAPRSRRIPPSTTARTLTATRWR